MQSRYWLSTEMSHSFIRTDHPSCFIFFSSCWGICCTCCFVLFVILVCCFSIVPFNNMTINSYGGIWKSSIHQKLFELSDCAGTNWVISFYTVLWSMLYVHVKQNGSSIKVCSLHSPWLPDFISLACYYPEYLWLLHTLHQTNQWFLCCYCFVVCVFLWL